jgi:hypothetical protein
MQLISYINYYTVIFALFSKSSKTTNRSVADVLNLSTSPPKGKGVPLHAMEALGGEEV